MSEETFTTNIGGCDPSDCASCTSDCAGAGQAIPRVPNPTIKLTLEDDSVLECAVLTTFDVEGFGEYIALIPLDKNGKNNHPEKMMKTRENPAESMDSDGFMVAGDGFEPPTSGL